ncbi:hypothetical protein AVEN_1528-1 [Araneus ventricosus]|uniref:Uncharacterized protein n=1 Tax=Araneus ventricosus TaxID=182803 RepID=A0A4Y2FAX6_ARAVE|nr:hypothetical protein AVEN_1528-1 [Araneus ventricosus]
MPRTTPELADPSPNFHISPAGERLAHDADSTYTRPIYMAGRSKTWRFVKIKSSNFLTITIISLCILRIRQSKKSVQVERSKLITPRASKEDLKVKAKMELKSAEEKREGGEKTHYIICAETFEEDWIQCGICEGWAYEN